MSQDGPSQDGPSAQTVLRARSAHLPCPLESVRPTDCGTEKTTASQVSGHDACFAHEEARRAALP